MIGMLHELPSKTVLVVQETDNIYLHNVDVK